MATPDVASQPGAARERALLVALVLGVLAWLGDKAFTVDDPLFLWIAEQVHADPLDPLGGSVVWNATRLRMFDINQNPPLVGYLIAAAAGLFGFGERALHAVFLLPAGLATAAIHALAGRFTGRPGEATLLAVATPAFLVSLSNVMVESWLLACWTGSLLLWVRGFDRRSDALLLGGAALAGLAFLTKFAALALLPLLFVYGAARERRPGRWCLYLLVPLATIAAYDAVTAWLYGTGHFSSTLRFARAFGAGDEGVRLGRVAVGLAFTGGCLLPALLYAPLLWSARVCLAALGLAAAGLVAWPALGGALGIDFPGAGADARWLLPAHLLLFALGGASAVAVALTDLWRRRDADGLLLAAWLLGMFVFAALANWVVNGRSILLMAPACAILLVRRLEAKQAPPRAALRGVALVVSVLLAVAVAVADHRWAGDVRASAGLLARRHVGAGHDTFFLGNWGLQWYLEKAGALAVDDRRWPGRGDRLIVSSHNTDRRAPPPALARELDTLDGEALGLRTLAPGVAGFYASPLGPLPWAWAPARDRYTVWELLAPVRFGPSW
ncbi:MAG: glycosyltransferase family 39 protein [Myxococcota bacterium]